MGIIELIIVICIVRFFVKKNQNKGKRKVGVPNQLNTPQRKEVVSQDELKRRLMEKYAGSMEKTQKVNPMQPPKKKYVSQQKTDILAKASANVAEDFTEKVKNEQSVLKTERMSGEQSISQMEETAERQLIQKADALAEVNLEKIYDVSQIQQNSELMKTVSDIMAKGVDTKLTFERDFVAEGMDMISNMTL